MLKDILIEIEKSDDPFGLIDIKLSDRNEIEISYHVKLLYQAGLIEAEDVSGTSQFKWIPVSLTWNGHEFLDAIRNDTVWKRLKEKVMEQGGNVPFSIIQQWVLKISENLLH